MNLELAKRTQSDSLLLIALHAHLVRPQGPFWPKLQNKPQPCRTPNRDWKKQCPSSYCPVCCCLFLVFGFLQHHGSSQRICNVSWVYENYPSNLRKVLTKCWQQEEPEAACRPCGSKTNSSWDASLLSSSTTLTIQLFGTKWDVMKEGA